MITPVLIAVSTPPKFLWAPVKLTLANAACMILSFSFGLPLILPLAIFVLVQATLAFCSYKDVHFAEVWFAAFARPKTPTLIPVQGNRYHGW